MTLKVTFELSDKDLKHFRRIMRETRGSAQGMDESDVIRAALALLEEVRAAAVPGYVLERIEKLDTLCAMLTDEDWQLKGRERTDVVSALAYFADPHDLIPDSIPGLGFLDDAIMVELVVLELQHEIEAFNDFIAYCKTLKQGRRSDHANLEGWIEARRRQLYSRMRRRRQSQRKPRRPRSRTPMSLF